eukprot:5975524-Pyramimonas_sp.AAC.1
MIDDDDDNDDDDDADGGFLFLRRVSRESKNLTLDVGNKKFEIVQEQQATIVSFESHPNNKRDYEECAPGQLAGNLDVGPRLQGAPDLPGKRR